MKIKTFSELRRLKTFEERYAYLRLVGTVGRSTFGYDRYLNQALYKSKFWFNTRDYIIVRDCGCDLSVDGYDIHGRIIIHHMNPITIEDIELRSDLVFDPEFLICTSPNTHNAIHYGDESLLPQLPIERRLNDTCPWRL
jgi:hypothetical protein